MISIESNAEDMAKDLEELKRKIEELVGTADVRTAGLRANPRKDGKGFSSNAELMDKLVEDDRDFFSLNDEESKQVVAVGEKELEKRAAAALKKGRELKPNAIWSGVYRAMIKEWMVIVQSHIESQTTSKGSPKPLNVDYAIEKLEDVGYETIGVYTKHLLDNFNPSLASRNIEIKLK